ncbi:MAG TPA: glycosyltransferase, partial [Propionibacteriaceae bacterium]|nr:glycosyltransferase [Propionibacteriaceae bacterium]
MTVKVSVVVPVYNPGEYIDPCIESLLSQSLPRAELELLFVNDGSTDDSLARLETYAAAHSQVRILSIPNSGWPGKPRNVGTDAAVGK